MQAKDRGAPTHAKKPHPETHRVGWVAWLCSMPSLCCSIAPEARELLSLLAYHERGKEERDCRQFEHTVTEGMPAEAPACTG
jgi:hypothetical protein